MLIQQIKETCLYVTDLERTREFYEGILELPVIGKVDHRHIFFRAGRSVLLCFIAEASRKSGQLPPHWAKGKQHIAFEVAAPDYEACKARLAGLGIAITHEEEWPNGLRSFYFEDPDGHVLEVVPAGLWEKR
ncbi:VOC family protein [Cesiribacter andamanensis]|uniref:Fosfomycin resistance protein FosB n=1 Tax=Cesiribacter andamanensis AMV16 TaxID=1279009 RepID=M7N2M1_9BACT|nr:VOC family protein [Cesiribacter andamanensis]EMR02918.1 fosfomycin resistance protein FosB [Cesiribacter andamanensis AMV16]